MRLSINDTTYDQLTMLISSAHQRVNWTSDLLAALAWKNTVFKTQYEQRLRKIHRQNLTFLHQVDDFMEAWARYHNCWPAN